MPFVVYSHYRGKYVSDVRNRKINYSPDIDDAKVYKSKGGALNAVGEDVSGGGDLQLPTHMEIIAVDVREGRIEEVQEPEEEKVPDFEYRR